MSDYIQEAAIIADGWDWTTDEDGNWLGGPDMGWQESIISQGALDALAAQLVRQVDAKYPGDFENDCNGTAWLELHSGDGGLIDTTGPDRTMNTLRAIIDSGVLEHG